MREGEQERGMGSAEVRGRITVEDEEEEVCME